MKLAALLLFSAAPILVMAQVCANPHPELRSNGITYDPVIIEKYKDLVQKSSASADALYVYGRVLIGTDTREAINELDKALKVDPNYARAHLSLVEIYTAPNFRDPSLTETHLEAWMKACPNVFEGFPYLERMNDSDFVRKSVARMRGLIDQTDDRSKLSHIRTLWALEFQFRPTTEHAQVRDRIREDLVRLRALDMSQNQWLASTLREGYKLTEDKEGLAWVNANAPANINSPNSGPMEAYEQWQTAHPFPTSNSNPNDSAKAFQERNKALLAATDEWIRKWPDNEFAWTQRLQALLSNRDVPDAEVERTAESALKTYHAQKIRGMSPAFQIASLYMQRNIHKQELPDLVKRGIADSEAGSPAMISDLYPSAGLTSPRITAKLIGLSTLAEIYSKSGESDLVRETLAALRTALDANKPSETASAMDKSQWAMHSGQYWDKKARYDDSQGHKLDALNDYENELREISVMGNRNFIRQRAKQVWTDLGGTEEGWATWGVSADSPKAVANVMSFGRWESLDKPLPDFEIADVAGKIWRLADLRGKTTLINLWATWCAPCREELPELQKLYDQMKDRQDVRIITLNADEDVGLIEPFMKEKGYTFPVLPARVYISKIVPSLSIPRNWIINVNTVIKLENTGYGPSDGDWTGHMKETIESMGKPN